MLGLEHYPRELRVITASDGRVRGRGHDWTPRRTITTLPPFTQCTPRDPRSASLAQDLHLLLTAFTYAVHANAILGFDDGLADAGEHLRKEPVLQDALEQAELHPLPKSLRSLASLARLGYPECRTSRGRTSIPRDRDRMTTITSHHHGLSPRTETARTPFRLAVPRPDAGPGGRRPGGSRPSSRLGWGSAPL